MSVRAPATFVSVVVHAHTCVWSGLRIAVRLPTGMVKIGQNPVPDSMVSDPISFGT